MPIIHLDLNQLGGWWGVLSAFDPATQRLFAILLATHLVLFHSPLGKVLKVSGGNGEWRGLCSWIWSTVAACFGSWLAIGAWQDWRIPAITFAAHLLAGFLASVSYHQAKRKAEAANQPQPDRNEVRQSRFWLVNLLHATAALVIAATLPGFPRQGFWSFLEILQENHFFPYTCGVIVAVWFGSPVIGCWTRKYRKELEAAAAARQADPHLRGFLDGGTAIGQWERFLIFVLIVHGQYAAVGFLVTAKSVFRFGEINQPGGNRKEAEYIIIGTLSSFSWAIATALAVNSWVTVL